MSKRRSLERHKGRQQRGRFLLLPQEWLLSPQWADLEPFELKLLIDLAAQYNGSNNGDLCAALSVLKPRGWSSSATLHKSLKALQQKGWLELTRQGGRHLAALYALTFWGIDECKGKHDLPPNPVPSHRWKNSLGSRVVEQCGRVVEQSTPAKASVKG